LHPIKEDPLVAESSFSFSRQRKIETAFKKSDAISKLKFCGFGTEMKKDGAFNNKNCRPLMEEATKRFHLKFEAHFLGAADDALI
jgi:hypothetical protein